MLAAKRVHPELLLVCVLVAGLTLLRRGLPLGIVGLGVVSGSLLALHAIGITLLGWGIGGLIGHVVLGITTDTGISLLGG